MRNEAPILPLKFKLSGKFQLFNAINRSIEMLKIVEFSNISIKMKKCKTFCKTQTANRFKNFIQSPPIPPPTPPPPDKTLLRLENKILFKKIYRNIQIFAFILLQECSSWVSRNDAVQVFFLTPHRNMFARKSVKPESFLAVFGSILFLLSSELRMTEVFLAKLYCKMCDLFC